MIPAHIAQWSLNREREKNDQRTVLHAEVMKDERRARREIVLPPTSPIDQRKLEFGGDGGTPPPPPQPSAQEEAEARDWEEQRAFERETTREEREAAKVAAAKAEKDAAWRSGRSGALERARTTGRSRLSGLGMADDPYGIGAIYGSRLDAANSALQEGDDYASAFSPTVFDEVLGEVRGGQRTKLKSAYNNAIDPYYAEDTFGATSDDQILAAILGEQYDDALFDINTARGRGSLNQAAYDRSIRDLDRGRATADAELQGIGAGVRRAIIEDIEGRRTSGLNRVAEWDFGDTFDPTREAGRIRSYGSERLGGLGGELRTAAGGRTFFDSNALMGKARTRVGNPTTPAIGGETPLDSSGTAALGQTFKNQAQKSDEGVF